MENDMKCNRWQRNSKMFLLLIILLVVSVLAGCRFSLSDEPLKPVNVLVLGVDNREGDIGRSDTIFVMSLDREENVATMLSIPRDSYVPIPGRGWDKINHAYAYGKGKLTRRTVENLLNIEIDYLVEVDRKGVEKMIDAIGGVEIDVEKRMYYEDPWDDDGGLVIDLEPGLQTLDGEEAIQYIRYRDKEGDIGRARRQQKFLAAAMDSIASPFTLVRLPRIAYACASGIETDMPMSEMVKLSPAVMMASYNGLEKIFADGQPTYINGVSYWALDIQNLRAKMANVVGDRYTKSSLRDAARMEEAVRAKQLEEEKRKEEEAKKAEEEKEKLEKEKLEKEGFEQETEKSDKKDKNDKKITTDKKRQDKKSTERKNSQ